MLKNKRGIAKLHRKNKEYNKAEPILSDLWNNRGENWDKWLGWEYADTLKKIGKIDEAIIVSGIVYKSYSDFKYNNDLLCWSLYEKYIKPTSKDSSLNELKEMLKVAEFIVKTVKQDGKKTSYESTVFKVIDILRSQNNVNENVILQWVEKLDFTLLSEDVITFRLGNGHDKEGASRKEEYFSIKTKALEKLNRYQECIDCCDIAFNTIQKFHYDNNIWFAVRRNYCICMISKGDEFDKAAQEIVKLAEKKRHWSIYNKAFDCYRKAGNYKKALQCGAKALLTKDPMDKKVTLLFNFGLLLENNGDKQGAIKHFETTYAIRRKCGWSIPPEMKAKINLYNIEDTANTSFNELNKLWLSLVQSNEDILYGRILSIMPHGRSGFISSNDRNNYFFRKTSIISGHNRLANGSIVSFRLIDSFDARKQIESKEAIDIVVE